jgi:hypothetical protein
MSLRDGYRHEQNLTVQLFRASGPQGSHRRCVEERKPVFRD